MPTPEPSAIEQLDDLSRQQRIWGLGCFCLAFVVTISFPLFAWQITSQFLIPRLPESWNKDLVGVGSILSTAGLAIPLALKLLSLFRDCSRQSHDLQLRRLAIQEIGPHRVRIGPTGVSVFAVTVLRNEPTPDHILELPNSELAAKARKFASELHRTKNAGKKTASELTAARALLQNVESKLGERTDELATLQEQFQHLEREKTGFDARVVELEETLQEERESGRLTVEVPTDDKTPESPAGVPKNPNSREGLGQHDSPRKG